MISDLESNFSSLPRKFNSNSATAVKEAVKVDVVVAYQE